MKQSGPAKLTSNCLPWKNPLSCSRVYSASVHGIYNRMLRGCQAIRTFPFLTRNHFGSK